ncbi:hypothetical protein HHL19_12890 [Streptomyces sp. R302]|uniref:zinc finger domain-containing protein n=1 Tax=unclassified Streptomyces TaxID=2593676 RepID=UPI00145C8AA8|nr:MULTISPECIES: hypothetical protein [unclassified Streptomyces]NML50557.1 hypothetical protein [Streptomyces sp. R301]NML79548.1 hypothetical protein [Streptomyces sp. R302]
MDVTIPGALADHLSRADLTTGPVAKHPAAADLRIALDNARRGRGRTLAIPAHGTAVLHLISAFAEAILENRKLHTLSEVRAARLWIQRAGHTPTPAPQAAERPHRGNLADTVSCPACRVGVGAPCITRAGKPAREIHSRRIEALETAAGITQYRAEQQRANGGLSYGINHAVESELFAAYAARINARVQAPAVIRDEPSNWWTITDPASGEEVARVYGETYQDMTPRAEALPEVRAVIRKHRGFSRRRLLMSELTPAQLDEQHAQEQPPTPAPTPAGETENASRARAAQRLRDALSGTPAAFEPETVEDVEARHAAELVTEAEATAGTWRGQWIGEHPDALFPARPDREQGSLFA